jgi:hypothetical protein
MRPWQKTSDLATDGQGRAGGPVGRAFKTLALGGLLLAIAYFTWRGVLRGAQDSGDLAVGYSAGRAWILGHDPYDAVVQGNDLILAGGADVAQSGLLDRLQNVYFPATLPAFAPLAVASWPVAKLLFLALNVGGVVFIALGLGRLLGWRPSEPRALALTAFLLALAPVHTTMASGQTAIVATAALLAAVLLGRASHHAWSGVLYGLATILKIQIGLPFVAYLFWRRRWVAGITASAVVAGSSLLAVVRMEGAGVPWASSWLANLGTLSGPGGINDPSPLNPERYSMINLQVLLFNFVPVDDLVNLLSIGLVAAAALALVWLIRGRDRQDLLALSVVAVLCLLVAYHRYYDAVLLAFPVAWALSVLAGGHRLEGVAVLLLSADFILPFQTALHDMQQNQRLPVWLTGGPLWETVLMSQHVWALVLMTVVLLFAAARDRAGSSLV